MAIIDSLGFAVDTSDLKKAQVELRQTGDSAKRAADKSEKSMSKFRKTMGGVRSSVFSLQGAIGALGVGLVFREVLQANEAWTNQTNALKLVTGSSKELIQVQSELFDLAQRTRSSTAGTVDLYSRLARSTKELGISQSRLVGVTETVNKAIAASGASGASADAALFQLGQGLAAGALRGEELNSVMEQTPRLAQALAEGLGVGTGELRKLGEQGKLTSEVVIAALENQAKAVDSEFNQTTKTVSQATTQLANEIQKTLGSIDNQGLIDAIDSIRKTLSDPAVVEGIQTLAQGMITIAEWAIKAAAGVAGIGKSIGTFAGRVATGVYLIEESVKVTATATEELAQKRVQLKLLEDQIAGLSTNMQSFGENVPQTTIDVFNKKIRESAKLAGDLRAQIEILETRAAKEPKKAAAIEEAIPAKPIIGVGEDKEDKKLQDQLQKRFESLQQGYFNETQLAIQAFNERTALITELEANKIGTDEERRRLSLESYYQFESELTSITEEEANKRQEIERSVNDAIRMNYIASAQSIASIIKDLGGKSRAAAIAALVIEKGAAAASVIANAEAAKFQAMASTPPVAWPGLFAAIETSRALSLGAIAASTISGLSGGGGGGSAPGTSAGGGQAQVSEQPPALAATQQDIPQREISIVMPEGLRSDAEVRALLERINEVNQDLGGNSKLVVA